VNCGPEFCGTVPRSAGSLFLAGEARRNCSGPARRYGFPPAHVAGRGTTSTSCKHFSVTGRPTSKTTTSAPGTGKSLPKRWWPELVAAECDTDRLRYRSGRNSRHRQRSEYSSGTCPSDPQTHVPHTERPGEITLLWRRVCGLMSASTSCGSFVLAWYLRMIHAMPPRLSLAACWLKNTGWSSWPGWSR